MRLRSKFAVKCAKATSSLIKKLNRGSGVTLPGYVARLIDPNILKELSGQVRKKDDRHNGNKRKRQRRTRFYVRR